MTSGLGETGAHRVVLQNSLLALPSARALPQHACVAELRAICTIAFGVVALFLTFLTFPWLVSLFVSFIFVDGMLAIGLGCVALTYPARWTGAILPGLANLLTGAALLLLPIFAVPRFALLLAIWSVVTGALGVGTALQLAGKLGRDIVLASGLASITWGIFLGLSYPATPAPLAWWLGLYAVTIGSLLLALAPQLRSHAT